MLESCYDQVDAFKAKFDQPVFKPNSTVPTEHNIEYLISYNDVISLDNAIFYFMYIINDLLAVTPMPDEYYPRKPSSIEISQNSY